MQVSRGSTRIGAGAIPRSALAASLVAATFVWVALFGGILSVPSSPTGLAGETPARAVPALSGFGGAAQNLGHPGRAGILTHLLSTSRIHPDERGGALPRPAVSGTFVSHSVAVGSYPGWATYDPADGFVYILNLGAGTMSILNGSSLVATVSAGTSPYGAVYDAKTGNVCVSDSLNNSLYLYNGTSRVAKVTVGTSPGIPGYDPKNGFVYVPNQVSGTVSVVNGSKVVATVTVGSGPWNATYDPTNGYVYVMNILSGSVSVLNGTKVLTTLPVGTYPNGAVYDPHNGWEYVSNGGGNNTTILNGTKVVATVGVGWDPSYGGYDPADQEVYIPNINSDNISILNGSRVVSTVSLSYNASGAIYDPIDRYMYVPDGGGQLLLLSGSTIISTVGIGFGSEGPTYDDGNGAVYVPNSNSDNVTIVQYQFGVTFSEQGLPAGTSWTVSLTGGAMSSSTGSQVGFGLTSGTYPYEVSSSDTTYSAPAGSFHVGAAPVLVSLLFSRVTYPVNFTEAGLPIGTPWSVTVAGVTQSAAVTSSPLLSFLETNGTAPYRVGMVPGWTTDRYSGGVSVQGAPVWVSLVWTQSVYLAQFQESGLPAGSGWWINVTGGFSTFSTSHTLNVLEPNGSYSFTVGSRNSSFEAPPGTFNVTGAQENLSVVFSLVVFQLSFIEYGLPVGTSWSVQLARGILHSSTPWANVSVPNGSYAFSVAPLAGWSLSRYSGVVTVLGTSIEHALSWNRVTYTVSFSETGLPVGTYWSVTFGGVTNGSTGVVSFRGFSNGTYNYSILPVSGFLANPQNGTVPVNGLAVYQQVVFGSQGCACPGETTPPTTFLGLPILEGVGLLAAVGAAAAVGAFVFLRRRRRAASDPDSR